jgi:hypothetical protein
MLVAEEEGLLTQLFNEVEFLQPFKHRISYTFIIIYDIVCGNLKWLL